jgi:alpha-D-xyloside xylohydrolase
MAAGPVRNSPFLPASAFPSLPPELSARGETAAEGPDVLADARVRACGSTAVTLDAMTAAGRNVSVDFALVSPGVIHVRLALEGRETNARPRFARLSTPPSATNVSERGGRVILSSQFAQVEAELAPLRLRFLLAGDIVVSQCRDETDVSGRLSVLPFGVSELEGDVAVLHESLWVEPDERFYGLGERFGVLDKRGQRVQMWHFDALGVHSERSYKNVPFLLSSRGYGLFVDSAAPIEFDVAHSNHSVLSLAVPEDVLDYYLIAGPTLQDVLRRYATLVGHPTLPPKWAFGYWLSSGYLMDSQEQALERARRMREESIPCDVFHLDCYWQRDRSLSDLVWDRSRFPDPERLIGELKDLGYRVSLWLNPCFSIESDRFTEAAEAGHLLLDPRGAPYVVDLWAGTQPPVGMVDFTSPSTRRWFSDLLRPLIRMGVDVLETDFGEGVPHDAVASDGTPGPMLHNLYPLVYNDVVAQTVAEETGRTPVLWARSTYAGGQRHAAQWGGDPNCTFQSMASTLRGGLSLAFCGHAFWSHDIGGLYGRPSNELYVRWAQFGLLSPLARAHGTTSRLPWDFGEQVSAIFREYTQLRYRLLPYLYTFAVVAAETGVPLMRPLALQFPDDRCAASAELQYMLGDELLVAPVFAPGGRRDVYLPAGRWIDFWTDDLLEGGRWIGVEAPLELLPLYVRADALVPTVVPADRIDDGPFESVTFHAYLLASGRFELRDVDGSTTVEAALDGASLRATVNGAKRAISLRLVPIQGVRNEELLVEVRQ